MVRKKAKEARVVPESIPMVVDIGGSRPSYGTRYAPCLTKSRAGQLGFWSMQHGSSLTVSEMLRLQGIDPEKVRTKSMTPNQMGQCLGNAFTQPVFEGVLRAALKAAVASAK